MLCCVRDFNAMITIVLPHFLFANIVCVSTTLGNFNTVRDSFSVYKSRLWRHWYRALLSPWHPLSVLVTSIAAEFTSTSCNMVVVTCMAYHCHAIYLSINCFWISVFLIMVSIFYRWSMVLQLESVIVFFVQDQRFGLLGNFRVKIRVSWRTFQT